MPFRCRNDTDTKIESVAYIIAPAMCLSHISLSIFWSYVVINVVLPFQNLVYARLYHKQIWLKCEIELLSCLLGISKTISLKDLLIYPLNPVCIISRTQCRLKSPPTNIVSLHYYYFYSYFYFFAHIPAPITFHHWQDILRSCLVDIHILSHSYSLLQP